MAAKHRADQMLDDPLTVQERLKDMQSLLILKSIRVKHDEEAVVLSALDHAIGILQKRVDKSIAEAADDVRINFLRRCLARVERGEAHITNIGVERERQFADMTSIADSAMHRIPVASELKYTIEVTSSEINDK